MIPRTLFEKVWTDHVIVPSSQGEELLYVDFNMINEGQSFLAFDQLRMEGRTTRCPQQHLAVTDHYLPTINRDRGPAGMPNQEIRRVVEMMDENAAEFRLPHIGWSHRDQGIAHVIGTRARHFAAGHADHLQRLAHRDPWRLRRACCADRRRQPAPPCGRDADGLAERPKTFRITIDGALPEAVTAKDIILSIINAIGAGGATGYAVEYAGSTIRSLSMEGRLTVCNMSIEAGARIGMIAPDDTTYAIPQRPALCAEGRGLGPARWRTGPRCRPMPARRSTASSSSMRRNLRRW